MGDYLRSSVPTQSIVTGQSVVPASVAITGLITVTSGNVRIVGTGTSFTTELFEGDWITYQQNRWKVKWIYSDTDIEVMEIPVASVGPVPMGRVKATDLTPRQIELDNVGGAAGQINGVSYAAGLKKRLTQNQGIGPLLLNGTGTTIEVLVSS